MRNNSHGDYARDGFVHLKRFFEPAELDAIRADAKRPFIEQMLNKGIVPSSDIDEATFEAGLFALFSRDLESFTNSGKQAQHLIAMHRLAVDPRLEEVLKQLGLRFPNISTRPVMFFNHPRLAQKDVYWRVAAHQDWRSMQGSLDAVVVWVPLVDISRELGALEVLPGSHRRGLLTTHVEDHFGMVEVAADADFRSVEVEQGDALLFSAFLVHRSGTNSSNSIRWSCHFRYNNLEEKTFIERGYPHPYLYEPRDDLLTPGFPDESDVAAQFDADRP